MSKVIPEKLIFSKGLDSMIHLRIPEGIKKGGYKITGYDAVFFLLAKAATAKLSPTKDSVVYLKLKTDITTARLMVEEMISALNPQMRAEDCKTYQKDGRGFSHNWKHCMAYMNATHRKDFATLKNKEGRCLYPQPRKEII
jgi:hypothetical protein